MKNKPTNVTSLIKKRDINKAKEILEKEFELIDSSVSQVICRSYF